MARQNDDDELSLFGEDELGPDHSVTNAMMDMRARVDALDVDRRAKLAEVLITMDLDEVLADEGGVSADATQRLLHKIFDKKITEFEAIEAAAKAGCFYCERPVSPCEVTMVRQTMWTDEATRKKLRVREDTGDVAHEECVERVSEGGDPGTKPMF